MQKFYVKETAGNPMNTPKKVYEEFKDLRSADQESFWIVGLNVACKTILKECVFSYRHKAYLPAVINGRVFQLYLRA